MAKASGQRVLTGVGERGRLYRAEITGRMARAEGLDLCSLSPALDQERTAIVRGAYSGRRRLFNAFARFSRHVRSEVAS